MWIYKNISGCTVQLMVPLISVYGKSMDQCVAQFIHLILVNDPIGVSYEWVVWLLQGSRLFFSFHEFGFDSLTIMWVGMLGVGNQIWEVFRDQGCQLWRAFQNRINDYWWYSDIYYASVLRRLKLFHSSMYNIIWYNIIYFCCIIVCIIVEF